MWYMVIFTCFLLINLCLSIPIKTKDQQIPSNNDLVNQDSCSIQSINIDHSGDQSVFIPFSSSWERTIVIEDDDHDGDSTTSLNIIQITFTIPYQISNQTIVNKTVFITDVIHNQLLASLTNFCVYDSSFLVNYSTIQPLPQRICLFLLLNLTSSILPREIIFCQTIDDSYNSTLTSGTNTTADTAHSVGPSGFFILSQCIIILLMMFIIYGVQTARQKNLVQRASERIIHSRTYITIFGNKRSARASSAVINQTINPATTLQAGLNQLMFNCRLTSVSSPIEEQVLAANDLTTTIHDRRATRPSINRDLINVKEFTKRMSAIAIENNATDTEL